MPATIPQPPEGGTPLTVEQRLAVFVEETIRWEIGKNRETDMMDWEATALDRRVSALEEILAARWPMRILVAWRLGRIIRRADRLYSWAGDTFAERRLQVTGDLSHLMQAEARKRADR